MSAGGRWHILAAASPPSNNLQVLIFHFSHTPAPADSSAFCTDCVPSDPEPSKFLQTNYLGRCSPAVQSPVVAPALAQTFTGSTPGLAGSATGIRRRPSASGTLRRVSVCLRLDPRSSSSDLAGSLLGSPPSSRGWPPELPGGLSGPARRPGSADPASVPESIARHCRQGSPPALPSHRHSSRWPWHFATPPRSSSDSVIARLHPRTSSPDLKTSDFYSAGATSTEAPVATSSTTFPPLTASPLSGATAAWTPAPALPGCVTTTPHVIRSSAASLL